MDVVHTTLPITAVGHASKGDHDLVIAGEGRRLLISLGGAAFISLSGAGSLQDFRGAIGGISVRARQDQDQRKGFFCLVHAHNLITLFSVWLSDTVTAFSAVDLAIDIHFAHQDLQDCLLFSSLDSVATPTGSDSEDVHALAITAHDHLYHHLLPRPPSAPRPGFAASADPTYPSFRQVPAPKQFALYSATATLVSSSLCLVAAGTAFGQVVLWEWDPTDFSSTSRLIAVVDAHDGSVFGLSLDIDLSGSSYFVSCSDDRTVKVWTLPTFSGADDRGGSETCQLWATGRGHVSRVWAAHLLRRNAHNRRHLRVISGGEDATVRYWRATGRQGNDHHENHPPEILRLEKTINDHRGRNVWCSVVSDLLRHEVVISGGADGQIICTRLRNLEIPSLWSLHLHSLPRTSGSKIEPKLSALIISGREHESLSVITSASEVHTVIGANVGSQLSVDRTRVLPGTGADFYCITSNVINGHTIFCCPGSLHGQHLVFDSPSFKPSLILPWKPCFLELLPIEGFIEPESRGPKRDVEPYLLAAASSSGAFELHWVGVRHSDGRFFTMGIKQEYNLSSVEIVQVTAVGICKDTIIIGSRAGRLLFITPDYFLRANEPISVAATTDRLHTDAITRIHSIDTPSASLVQSSSPPHILVASRAGFYSVLRLESESVNSTRFIVLDQVRTPLVSSLESATLSNRRQLILAGFSGKAFVAYNASTQQTLLRVETGRGHRKWMYDPKYVQIAWCRGNELYWSGSTRNDEDEENWDGVKILKTGGQGREVKSCDALRIEDSDPLANLEIDLGMPLQTGDEQAEQSRWLLATGSEDCTVRISLMTTAPASLDSSQTRTLTSTYLKTLYDHITGLQQVKLISIPSRVDTEAARIFLLSSGGACKLLIHRLHYIPNYGLGSVLTSAVPVLHDEAELRITAFDIKGQASGTQNFAGAAWILAVAYSDSTVRLWHPADDQQRDSKQPWRWTMVSELHYSSCCPLHVNFQGDLLLIAGTDGVVYLYDVAGSSEMSETCNEKLKSSMSIALHQGAALSMEILDVRSLLGDAENTEAQHLLLYTGGDDGTFSVSHLEISRTQVAAADNTQTTKGLRIERKRTILVPRAHAAAITGLIAIAPTRPAETVSRLQVTSLSVGNDQLIKGWVASVVRTEQEWQMTLGRDKGMDRETDVADLSGVAALRGVGSEHCGQGASLKGLVVGGIGTESWLL